jgi:hypothetical protein
MHSSTRGVVVRKLELAILKSLDNF